MKKIKDIDFTKVLLLFSVIISVIVLIIYYTITAGIAYFYLNEPQVLNKFTPEVKILEKSVVYNVLLFEESKVDDITFKKYIDNKIITIKEGGQIHNKDVFENLKENQGTESTLIAYEFLVKLPKENKVIRTHNQEKFNQYKVGDKVRIGYLDEEY